MALILENGVAMEVSEPVAVLLEQAGLIYDSGDNYYHHSYGVSWEQIDAAISKMQQ